MKKLRMIYSDRIGIRTIYKSFYVYSKGKKYSVDKSVKDFEIGGNSKINLKKTSKIVNKGTFSLGIPSPTEIIPTKRPSILQMLDNSSLIINGRFGVKSGTIISVFENATLEVGNNVDISFNSKILCFENIRIGENSMISWDVEIIDSDLHPIVREGYTMTKPIVIGNHVLICSRATILKGVKIGDDAIIAAGAVVTRDVPENCLAAGVPAIIIRKNIEWKTAGGYILPR